MNLEKMFILARPSREPSTVAGALPKSRRLATAWRIEFAGVPLRCCTRVWQGSIPCTDGQRFSCKTPLSEWAMLVSNQRPLPCEGSTMVRWSFLEIAKFPQIAAFLWWIFSRAFRGFTRVAARLLHKFETVAEAHRSF